LQQHEGERKPADLIIYLKIVLHKGRVIHLILPFSFVSFDHQTTIIFSPPYFSTVFFP